MSWSTVSAPDALARLKRGARALDVRSEGEFEQGAIPGFFNVPILNNEHRHVVGLTYKQKGQPAAIELGLQLVNPLRPRLVDRWREHLCAAPDEARLLICWRGGLRSKMTAEWLAVAGVNGFRVEGGYKALRRELLAAYQMLPEFLVLGGFTGSGKTVLLGELPSAEVLDLEGLAKHRGSSFGDWIRSQQPAQQTFENAVALHVFEGAPMMVVEAESRMVGRCFLPAELKAKMDSSAMIRLEVSMESRVRHIFNEYVTEPLREHSAVEVLNHLHSALERIQRKLGGLRFQAISEELKRAFESERRDLDSHAAWIESLLREYYDPLYEHSLTRDERPVVFRGDYGAVKDYLTDRLSRRRS